jgi:uncharacterized protein (UPF0261 family)
MLFSTIEQHFRTGANHKLQRLPLHINDDAFADALTCAWNEMSSPVPMARRV